MQFRYLLVVDIHVHVEVVKIVHMLMDGKAVETSKEN